MSDHTPTPWRIGDYPIVEYNRRSRDPFHEQGGTIMAGTVEDDIAVVIGGCQDEQGGGVGVLLEADAEFIVRAVNNHDELQAACQLALEWHVVYPFGNAELEKQTSDDLHRRLDDVVRKAKGAVDE